MIKGEYKMGLFDNVGNLFDMFTSGNNKEQETLANRAGVDQSEFSKIASVGLPMLLQRINRNTNDEAGNNSFNTALRQHEDYDRYSSINDLSANVDPQDGQNILDHVFGNKDNVANEISNKRGVSSKSVISVLSVLAPIVMKYFAHQKKTNNLDNRGLQNETTNVINQLRNSFTGDSNRASNHGGLLDSFFGGSNNNEQSNRTNQKDDDSLLDNVKDLFS